jgi:hypothetical protein
MKQMECEFEPEVLAAALQGRWPERVDDSLRAHALHCAICSDVAVIAGNIDSAREEMSAGAVVPDAGRVWRHAQVRAFREAARAAGRPITAVQVLAFACAAGLLGACFGATSGWFQSALKRVGSAVAALDLHPLLPAAALLESHGALLLIAAAIVFLVPAAVYLTFLRD